MDLEVAVSELQGDEKPVSKQDQHQVKTFQLATIEKLLIFYYYGPTGGCVVS